MLIIPHFQLKYKWFEEDYLQGYVKKINKPTASYDALMETKYQSGFETYLSRNFGFRTTAVRIYNQYQFWAFKKAKAYSIVVGNNNSLFAKGYLNAFTGKTYLGDSIISDKSKGLLKIQNDLEAKGKNLLVVIAASKSSFFLDDIPDIYLKESSITNYAAYLEKFNDLGINHIDFNEYLLKIKDSVPFPVYPRNAIHWSNYGSYLAADSLLRYIEKTSNKDLPDMLVDSIEIKPPYGDDNDIERSLNLIFTIPDIDYAYPKLSYYKASKDSLNILVIADSFYWQFYRIGLHKEAFGEGSKFWFYYQEVYPDQEKIPTNARDLDFIEQMDHFDYIILLTQDGTFHSFAWDFIADYTEKVIGQDK
jgi:hypothetical protein